MFYPKGTTPGQYLSHVAGQFPFVEVDSTFYHVPRPSMVEGWRDKTPANFAFSLKVPQSITHEKLLKDCQAEVNGFVGAARLLGDKLACCLLQFGYFNRKAFTSLEAFLERLQPFLDQWPHDVPVALELRNKAWVTEELLDCLRARHVTFALTDQAWMPSPLSMMEKLDVVTGPFGYVRLLGDRKAVDDLTPTLDHIVIDRSEQIRDDAKAIKKLSENVPVICAMPKSIPEGLTQQHVLSALADLDAGISSSPFGSPTRYELLHNGKRYAPKAVIGLAFKHSTGLILDPEEFSGGEAPGQAYVLRDLGFNVVAKNAGAREGFITSRGFALPTDAGEMVDNLWFNMWQRRL